MDGEDVGPGPPATPGQEPEDWSARRRLPALARRVLGADGVRLHESAADLADDVLLRSAAAGPLVVEDVTTDVRTAGAPEVAAGQVGAVLAVPLLCAGRPTGCLAVHSARARRWSDDEVGVLVEVAAALAAALLARHRSGGLAAALESGRLRSDLAVEAAGVGGWELDVASGQLRWDERMIAMFGYEGDGFRGRLEEFTDRLHPDDRERVEADIAAAVAARGDFASEYRVVLPSGAVRWIQGRGRVVVDADGAVLLVGACYDTTDAEGAEAGVRRVLEVMPAAFFALDRGSRFTYVNAEAERLLRRERAELVGGCVWELFPAAVGSRFDREYREAMRSGRPSTFESYYPAPLEAWFEVRVWPLAEGLSVYFLDVTDRRAAAERQAQEQARRDLLARVSADLAAALDPELVVSRLAQLVVPTLADWSVVTLVRDDGRPEDVGSWHRDEELRPLVARYARHRVSQAGDRVEIERLLAPGLPVVLPEPAYAYLTGVLPSGEARNLLAELAPRTCHLFPLVARGRLLGVLNLFRGPERGAPGPEDLATLQLLAERAGVALDNARLYRVQLGVAEELQRSLLTAPPAPDHTEIAVRYVAAAETARVGGDWYDALLQRDGSTVVVIGDVVGHDTAAAAAMGQLRALLRGIAFHSGAGPAETLAGLDAAMEGLQLETTATAVVARVEQTPQARTEGRTRLRWSNAGHPPPMLVTPDGEVRPLLARRTDLLLGIVPETGRTEGEVVLERGSTLVLYTDGLVERRGEGLDEGLARLQRELAGVAHLPLEEMLDGLLLRLLPGRRQDDVALLAVRLHRQGEPGPPRDVPPEVPPDPAG